MIVQFNAERTRFLLEALADAKKWCPAPDAPPVEGKKVSDQFWIQLFSHASSSVTADEASKFFRDFEISTVQRGLDWDWEAIASTINEFRVKEPSDVQAGIEKLADDLGHCTRYKKQPRQASNVKTKKNPRQTSAASKIAFFTYPCHEVFIWDTNVRASARLRRGRSRIARGYASYANSCAKALQEERRREDFIVATQAFSKYLIDVGGPMADSRLLSDSSFVERRLLDKLMFKEGVWIVKRSKEGRDSKSGKDTEREGLTEVPLASGLSSNDRPNHPAEPFVDASDEAFRQAAAYVLKKNAELYRRLA